MKRFIFALLALSLIAAPVAADDARWTLREMLDVTINSYNSDEPVSGRDIEESWAEINVRLTMPVSPELSVGPFDAQIVTSFDPRWLWAYGDSSATFAENDFPVRIGVRLWTPWSLMPYVGLYEQHVSTGEGGEGRTNGWDRGIIEPQIVIGPLTLYPRVWVLLDAEDHERARVASWESVGGPFGRDFGASIKAVYTGQGGVYAVDVTDGATLVDLLFDVNWWGFDLYATMESGEAWFANNMVDFEQERTAFGAGLHMNPADIIERLGQ